MGSFRLGAPRATPLDSIANIGSIAAGDLDGDGRPDLAYRDAIRFPPFSIETCHNEGAGVFTPSARIGIGPYSGPLAVADENGDGHLDLLVRQADDPAGFRISVFRGDGRGAFGTETRRALPPDSRLENASGPVPLDWDSAGTVDYVLGTDHGLVVVGPEAPRVDVTAVPVLLSTTGYYGSRFDSDLLLTNTGTKTLRVGLHYVAQVGGGSGVVTREIGAGEQLFAPSALAFLREAGLSIAGEGPLVGILRVETSGATLPSALNATVRTTSPGGAGVSWAGVASLDALRGDSLIPWLIESDRDRTNIGLAHAGGPGDGPITLRVTLESGDPWTPAFVTLADVVLSPGGFYQFGRALPVAGLRYGLGWA